MIPQNFDYAAPTSLQEALGLLANENAKPLAGGMSLIPLMKFRFAAPEQIVDLGRLPDLNYVREENGELHIGAMATHYEIESSPLIRSKCPLLAQTAASIGDVQVRNMGTIGGSCAHADPAADYPAALFALDAKFKLAKAGAERTVPVEEFFVDTFSTALEPGEIIVEVIVPVEASSTGTSYQKMAHPASGFAVVGVAVRLGQGLTRVGVTGLAGTAFRAKALEEHLDVSKIAEGVSPNSDLFASADYRAQLARVYAARAIKEAQSRTS